MTDAAELVSLARDYEAAKAADPGLRPRDFAQAHGASEGALLEARRGRGVRRLIHQRPDFASLIGALPGLGPVMTLTRNEAAAHETTGRAGETAGIGAIGQVTGEIDLRLFYRGWRAGYEVEEETRSGLRRSFQIFDRAGESILKIFAVAETDMAAWSRLAVASRAVDAPAAHFAPSEPAPERPDAEIDVAALRAGWAALDHSHDFAKLLRETGAAREQALRLAGQDYARPAAPGALDAALKAAASDEIPIMVFVQNTGCVQIFSGPVKTIKRMGPWLNVLDPGFNLHLRTDLVASVWLVTKPTRQRGPITSLEAFDAAGALVLQMFGVRPAGEHEAPRWRALAQRAAGL